MPGLLELWKTVLLRLVSTLIYISLRYNDTDALGKCIKAQKKWGLVCQWLFLLRVSTLLLPFSRQIWIIRAFPSLLRAGVASRAEFKHAGSHLAQCRKPQYLHRLQVSSNLSPRCRSLLISVYNFLRLSNWISWKSPAQITNNQQSNFLTRCLFLPLIDIQTENLISPGESPAGRCVVMGTAGCLLVWPHNLVIYAKRNWKKDLLRGQENPITSQDDEERKVHLVSSKQHSHRSAYCEMTQRGFSVRKHTLSATCSD